MTLKEQILEDIKHYMKEKETTITATFKILEN